MDKVLAKLPICSHGNRGYCGLCEAGTAPECAHGNSYYCGLCEVEVAPKCAHDGNHNWGESQVERELIRKVINSLEMSPTNRCIECGRSRMLHLLKPLDCEAVVGMLRARLGL